MSTKLVRDKKSNRLIVGDAGLTHSLENDVSRKTRVNRWKDLFFIWIIPYVLKGFRDPLLENEIPINPKEDKSDQLYSRASYLWDLEIRKKGPAKASLIKGVLIPLQRFELTLGTFASFFQASLNTVVRPLLLGKLIELVSDSKTDDITNLLYVLIFAVVLFLEALLQAQVKQLLSCRLGSRFFSWMSCLVYQKSMTVSSAAVSESGLQETALIGGDIQRMIEDWRWMSLTLYVIFALIGGVSLLIYVLGKSSAIGISIMFSIAFFNHRLTQSIAKIEKLDFAAGDFRISILTEILNGIKAIKMMAWEVSFEKQITEARETEADLIRKFRSYQVTSVNLGRASPVLAACFSILVLALTNPSELTAARIFVAISSFQGLRLPLIAGPQMAVMMANTFVSFKRLKHYLTLADGKKNPGIKTDLKDDFSLICENASFCWNIPPDLKDTEKNNNLSKKTSIVLQDNNKNDETAHIKDDKKHDINKISPKIKNTEIEDINIDIELSNKTENDESSCVVSVSPIALKDKMSSNGNRSTTKFSLKNISYKLRRNNHLVAIVGRVGAGKSSLLSCLLSSMFLENGNISITEKKAFVPQKSFVISGTILDNILMGTELDEKLLEQVLHATAMDIDMKLLSNGIETEIGERGQTLSGGQQARINMARALYSKPELLILDDVLSAVDPEVANHLFRRSVLGYLGRFGDMYNYDENQLAFPPRPNKRSVLMTLNQLHLLPQFDHVIVVNDGEIIEQGTYQELMSLDSGHLSAMLDGIEAANEDDLETLFYEDKKSSLHENSKNNNLNKNDGIEKNKNGQILEDSNEKKKFITIDLSSPKNEKQKKVLSKENHVSLILAESGKSGAVSKSIMKKYVSAMEKFRLPCSFFLALCAYGFMAAADLYLANWIVISPNLTYQSDNIKYAIIYICLALVHVTFIEFLSINNTRSSVIASKNIHSQTISKILHSPIAFFESTSSGRIIGRFSGDLSMVDRQLAFIYDDLFQFIHLLLALCFVVSFIVPIIIPILIFGISIFFFEIVAIDRTNREVKRYTNQSLSPILTNLSEAVDGREIIRGMNFQNYFIQRHYSYVNRYTTNTYMSHTLINFSTLMAGMVSFGLSTSAAIVVVFKREDFEPALVGLALTYSFLIPYFLSILSIVIPIGLGALTSLERILEYNSNDMKQEPDWYTNVDNSIIKYGYVEMMTKAKINEIDDASKEKKKNNNDPKWPSNGSIEFNQVCMRYRNNLPLALNKLSFSLNGGTSLGVCGRTGAGKSSLSLVLFRIQELCGGSILIDGVDISKIGLQLLRSSMAIIPQTALLFSGSFRKNLDPFSDYTDQEIYDVMDKVGLNRNLLLTSIYKKNEQKKKR